MSPIAWFTLVILTIVALAGMSQVPLISDSVATSGFSSAEVFAGIGAVLMFFYVIIAIFEVR